MGLLEAVCPRHLSTLSARGSGLSVSDKGQAAQLDNWAPGAVIPAILGLVKDQQAMKY